VLPEGRIQGVTKNVRVESYDRQVFLSRHIDFICAGRGFLGLPVRLGSDSRIRMRSSLVSLLAPGTRTIPRALLSKVKVSPISSLNSAGIVILPFPSILTILCMSHQ